MNSNIVEPQESNKSSLDIFSSRKEYLVDIKIADEVISLIGGDVISFSHNENQYTVVNSTIFKNGEESSDFEVDFWNITPQLIGELLKNKEEDYVSNFKDGSIKRGYYITLYDFIELFDKNLINSGIENIPQENILVIIEEINSKIQSAELELNSYYHFITGEKSDFNIILKY